MKLTGKANGAVETLRKICGQNWSAPGLYLARYDSTARLFPVDSLSYGRWHHMDIETDDIDIEGVVIGYSNEIVPVAAMLGAIDYDPKVDSSFLYLPIAIMEGKAATADSRRESNTLIESLPVVFDERKRDVPVKTAAGANRSRWWRPEFVYNGSNFVPDDLAYIYCRNRFLGLIEKVWNDSFIIRPRKYNSRSKSVEAISRASRIANLLLLDRGKFDVFAKKGKCPSWQVSALKQLDITPNAFSPEMKDVFSEVSRLQDVADFWCCAADDYGWALRLSTDDLEDSKIAETRKRIAKMAELIDLESYLDAYEAGVPASDILA